MSNSKKINNYIKSKISSWYDEKYVRNYSVEEVISELPPEAQKEIQRRNIRN